MRTEDILMGAFAALIGIGALLYFVHKRRARRDAVMRAVSMHGWDLVDAEAGRIARALKDAHLLQHYGKVRNVVRIADGEDSIMLFDFHYTVGPSGNRKSIEQTVAAFQLKNHPLPDFCLKPKQQRDVVDKIVDKVVDKVTGRSPEPTTGHASLDDDYELHSAAAGAGAASPMIPAVLADALRLLDESIVLEVTNGWAMVYRQCGFLTGEQMKQLAEDAMHVAAVFRHM